MSPVKMSLETRRPAPPAQPFPPRLDYASLSLKDLLDAREAYHVHLASLENVVATAVGRYLIHEDDWYAANPPDRPRPPDVKRVTGARTLLNSVVRSWSWPAVLVFVRKWERLDELRRARRIDSQEIPRTLFLPDGRMVPTCVVEATPDESEPAPAPLPSYDSPLVGGGYPCVREHQGESSLGTFSCLVRKGGSYYALTNRHVAGGDGETVKARIRGAWVPVGRTTSLAIDKVRMSEVFDGWSVDSRLFLTGDAGLIRIEDVRDWTSQAFGIGEVGDVFDATPQSVTLDLIDLPVRAYGGASGVAEGCIRALFYRYKSLGGFEYATDLLIGPRADAKSAGARPLTSPGDSGTIWFHDPSPGGDGKVEDDFPEAVPGIERGRRARRLRPIAMQWGGQRIVADGGRTSSFALATFVSSVCRVLDVEIVRDWSVGHDEYWGKIGHFAIGWKACDLVAEDGKLGRLMRENQPRIGFGDDKLGAGSAFRQGRAGFVPLADVPDYVWVSSRKTNEPRQHFADVDLPPFGGGAEFLASCAAKPKTYLSARKWKEFFDGFRAQEVGPDEGCLPFRVWQIWEEMVRFLRDKDVLRFVAAAGVLAHYVGDASQPLHCSHLHHGVPPTKKTVKGRRYGPRHDDPEYAAWQKEPSYKIHALYEERMLEGDTLAALQEVDDDLRGSRAKRPAIRSGYDAALETVRLMAATQKRLPPAEIVRADDPELPPKARAERLWGNERIREGTVAALADSVRLLAALWRSAFAAGGGERIAASKIRAYEERELERVYRTSSFLPSLPLAKMAASGEFEPPA